MSPPPSPHQTPGPSWPDIRPGDNNWKTETIKCEENIHWLISFLWDDNEKIRDVNCIVAPTLSIKFQYPIQWSRSWIQPPWRTFWQESSKKHPLTPVRWQNYSANWRGILLEVINFFLKLVHNLSVTNMFVNLTKPSPYVKVLNKLLYTECKLRSWAKQTQHNTVKDFYKYHVLANSNWETMHGGSLYANDKLWLCQIV